MLHFWYSIQLLNNLKIFLKFLLKKLKIFLKSQSLIWLILAKILSKKSARADLQAIINTKSQISIQGTRFGIELG